MNISRYGLRPAVVTIALCLVGCGSAGSPPIESPTPSGSSSPSRSASPMPSPVDCAQQVFDSMSEAQRVGQLFIFGLRDNELGPAEIAGIKAHHFGSVSFIQTTHEGVAGVRDVADATQALASKANTARVRFYVAANQEGGVIQALQGPGFSTMPTAGDQGKLSTSTLE